MTSPAAVSLGSWWRLHEVGRTPRSRAPPAGLATPPTSHRRPAGAATPSRSAPAADQPRTGPWTAGRHNGGAARKSVHRNPLVRARCHGCAHPTAAAAPVVAPAAETREPL